MPSYIAIQSTYDIFEMALFLNDICVDHIQEDKRHTSKLFIPLLEKLLISNSVSLTDLDFCVVNCGPAPFSTLRSVIASVNGLHLGMGIPLIGIDGLQATFLEFYDPHYENTVVLLNAFNHEVYYLIAHKGQIMATGYKKIDILLDDLSYPARLTPPSILSDGDPDWNKVEIGAKEYPRALEEILQPAFAKASAGRQVQGRCLLLSLTKHQDERRTKDIKQNNLQHNIHFLGNGVTIYHDLIKQTLGNNAIITTPNPAMCSVKMIGSLGIEKWRSKQFKDYLLPLHLKKHAVEL